MGIGDVATSSFEFYEGIRILVPGAIAVGLYAAVSATYGVHVAQPSTDLGGAFVAALVVGLVLLYLDFPAKSAAYFSPQLPTDALEEWGMATPSGMSNLNIYFVMLDEAFPAGIRNRALYTGSMFRIGFEAIYLLAFSTVVVLALSATRVRVGVTHPVSDSMRVVLATCAGAQLLLVAVAFIARYRRRRRAEHAWRKTGGEFLHDLGGAGGFVLAAASAGAVATIWLPAVGDQIALGTGIGLTLVWWAIRYLIGRPDGNRPSAIASPAAVSLYGSSVMLAAGFAAARIGPTSSLRLSSTVGWASATVVASLLMIARGHERKLTASYVTQSTWMNLHREELLKRYSLKTSASLADERRTSRTRP